MAFDPSLLHLQHEVFRTSNFTAIQQEVNKLAVELIEAAKGQSKEIYPDNHYYDTKTGVGIVFIPASKLKAFQSEVYTYAVRVITQCLRVGSNLSAGMREEVARRGAHHFYVSNVETLLGTLIQDARNPIAWIHRAVLQDGLDALKYEQRRVHAPVDEDSHGKALQDRVQMNPEDQVSYNEREKRANLQAKLAFEWMRDNLTEAQIALVRRKMKLKQYVDAGHAPNITAARNARLKFIAMINRHIGIE